MVSVSEGSNYKKSLSSYFALSERALLPQQSREDILFNLKILSQTAKGCISNQLFAPVYEALREVSEAMERGTLRWFPQYGSCVLFTEGSSCFSAMNNVRVIGLDKWEFRTHITPNNESEHNAVCKG